MTKNEMETFFAAIMERCDYRFAEAGPMILDYMRQDGELRAAIMRDGQRRVVWQMMEEYCEMNNENIRKHAHQRFLKEQAETDERKRNQRAWDKPYANEVLL